MCGMEETNKERLLVLGRLNLINQELVFQMLNQPLKLIRLTRPLKRLMMVILRALLEQSASLRTIYLTDQKLHKEGYGIFFFLLNSFNHDIPISVSRISYL